ncbi:MAG: SRPBCC domain-containing protein [Verrucomicrobia bacterium]|nr:SRPBCC domain-containing protein [Verrucomicrobiota bacterium]MDA1069679.1 SRPBCC domain-containing protein [Verrucomicrobiota bacterium]
MDTSQSLSLLEIRKTLAADPQTVFNALSKPELLNQWMYAMDEGSARTEVDLQVGGKYSVAMINQAGETVATPYGKFIEIDPPHKLSMTWITDGFVDYSLLTFELKEVDGGTELTLRHELPETTVEDHRGGWTNCLQHLNSIL